MIQCNQLPKDMQIIWNKRLLKTAGYCRNRQHRIEGRSCIIELSVKVIDTSRSYVIHAHECVNTFPLIIVYILVIIIAMLITVVVIMIILNILMIILTQ